MHAPPTPLSYRVSGLDAKQQVIVACLMAPSRREATLTAIELFHLVRVSSVSVDPEWSEQ